MENSVMHLWVILWNQNVEHFEAKTFILTVAGMQVLLYLYSKYICLLYGSFIKLCHRPGSLFNFTRNFHKGLCNSTA
jgi:hypothetical protein